MSQPRITILPNPIAHIVSGPCFNILPNAIVSAQCITILPNPIASPSYYPILLSLLLILHNTHIVSASYITILPILSLLYLANGITILPNAIVSAPCITILPNGITHIVSDLSSVPKYQNILSPQQQIDSVFL